MPARPAFARRTRLAAVTALALIISLYLGFTFRATHAPAAGPGATEHSGPAAPPAPAAPFDPTEAYEDRSVEGWTVRVNRKLLVDADLAARTLRELEVQLYHITRAVPAEAVEKLRKVTIWVELHESHHPCMAYHPDAGWLAANDMNPDKVRCVELANAQTFLEWTHLQPWMVLHELAHAYHDQFLPGGFENREVKAAYRDAAKARRYEAVLRNDGVTQRAYALNNQMEYFAELTEATFGTNDFYPFISAELKQHDPGGYDAVRAAWGVPDRPQR